MSGGREMTHTDPNNLRRGHGLGRDIKTFPDGGGAMRRKRVFQRFKNMDVKKLTRRGLERGTKWLKLYRTPHPDTEKRPVFVLGCNRSGTNMVCRGIGKHSSGWDYPEAEFSLAFNGYYLRADWVIERLIRYTPAPIVSFGSILDSQFAEDLLSRYEHARAIWIYRRYQDVANSCARMKWGPHLKEMVGWVAQGQLEKLGARGKRISGDTIRLFSELYRDDLPVKDGACLYWYLRNQLYFNLNLDQDPRVLLVQYEDAVLNKEKAFRRIFDFLDFPYDPATLEGIFASSVGKHDWSGADPAIEAVCGALTTRLDARYAETSDWQPEGMGQPVENVARVPVAGGQYE
jgi:hypothetical protein